MKVRMPMEVVRSIYKIRAMLNCVEFADIEWTENGEAVEIPEDLSRFYQFSGLDNFGFVKYGWDEPERVCFVEGRKVKEKDDGEAGD